MVSPDSDRVSRVRPYSGAHFINVFFRIRDSHPVSSAFPCSSTRFCRLNCESYNPKDKSLVWAFPCSLAATLGISMRFLFLRLLRCLSSAGVASLTLCIQIRMIEHYFYRIAPFGILRIIASFQLPEDYRRYARPSSPIDAKASTSSP